MTWDWIGPAIDVRALFPVERSGLLGLLTGIDPADWRRSTACPGWDVHDIVAHIVHDHVRRLSSMRDRHVSAGFGTGEDLAGFINRTNEEFVQTARRWSPRVLVDMLGHLGPQLDAAWATLEPDEAGAIDVAWAAPGVPAPHWLDVARELSEFWIHQHQVRDAVGSSGIEDGELAGAVADTLIRALPRALSGTPATAGARLCVQLTGPGARSWVASSDGDGWRLERAEAGDTGGCEAVVQLTTETLWRLGSRMISPEVAAGRAVLTGDDRLCRAALTLVSVIR